MTAPKAIFIGMPGVGKSAVGRRVAKRMGLDFADTDWLIEERTGKSIEEIFAHDGEAVFREIEADVIAAALQDFSGILSLGGGAITHPRTQELLRTQRVILIEAEDHVLATRLRNSPNIRPILADDVEARLGQIRKTRLPIYRSLASEVLISNEEPVYSVVEDAMATIDSAHNIVKVAGEKEYRVIIGRHLQSAILSQAQRYPAALIICAPQLAQLAQSLQRKLKICGVQVEIFMLPCGEAAKDVQVLAAAWEAAGKHHLGRDGLIITVGGGATTDLGGFVAATWLRGIDVIHVPTTLLGMVDAAIGGKTGINTGAGKNLAGSFHAPVGVYCDLDTLATLPIDEIRAGMGEVIKCGFIADKEILQLVAQHGRNILNWQNPGLTESIFRAIKVKAEIVSSDFRESGMREFLNYGHTFGHAIERAEDYQKRHGEAVAIGCVFASALAEAAQIAPPGFTKLHHDAFLALGLPVAYPQGKRDELSYFMYADKKVRQGELRFVILRHIGQPEIITNPSQEVLDKAFTAIGIHSASVA
ncbi:3-dehydroquinate synthase [Arcanobacterium hippocoleae]|uniref:Multifunctional fusion protein n=1 Tax=Arcanobacterium hippocoleae TaxID=149017 RepID=A0ABU1T068_9ACTO|nr:3-dehydroquinate synthase [Arcanobacterium hippocoleae]MDR6938753.1 3-dehydroquinate synthase [Arcanobacterium hippocoleae]